MGLQYKVFYSKRPSVTRSAPVGNESLKWVPTTSTLIYGDKDAVLVDAQLTKEASKDLLGWILATGKTLSYIYITHGHGDHFFGLSIILQAFPFAKVVATPEVVARMKSEILPERINDFWNRLFPGQLPLPLTAKAHALTKDEFALEMEKCIVVRTGHTDTDDTTSLWIPSIRLLVAGDSVYNNVHPFLGEGGQEEARTQWISALDTVAALKPLHVVGGHSDPKRGFSPEAIAETKTYLQDFGRIKLQCKTAEDLYTRMLELHPDRINPGSLWAGATAVFTYNGHSK